jgi:DNA-binding GntR family transcriptional regulator
MIEVAQGSLSHRTYLALREGLIRGDFASGERLLMQELAERLGTSITPVREACLRLVSEQALELQSGRFVTVPALTRSRYWQIRLIRIALEGLATELAVDNMTPPCVVELARIHEAFVAAESSGAAEKARQLNRMFHFEVYRACGLEMLVRQIENMWVAMGPIFNVYYRSGENDYVGAEEHLNLIDAITRKDRAAARAAIENDIRRGGLILMRHFDGQESGQEAGQDAGHDSPEAGLTPAHA